MTSINNLIFAIYGYQLNKIGNEMVQLGKRGDKLYTDMMSCAVDLEE